MVVLFATGSSSVTVAATASDLPPTVTVMFAVPFATPVTRPFASTDATAVFEECHVSASSEVTSVPSAASSLAVS